jgi:hypothetical protein
VGAKKRAKRGRVLAELSTSFSRSPRDSPDDGTAHGRDKRGTTTRERGSGEQKEVIHISTAPTTITRIHIKNELSSVDKQESER